MLARRRGLAGPVVVVDLVLVAVLLAGSGSIAASPAGGGHPFPPAKTTTRPAAADEAFRMLERQYYDGAGAWRYCVPAVCGAGNLDWGADSLTYALHLRWRTTRDPAVSTVMKELVRTAPRYTPAVVTWSDVPMWDSIAGSRAYEVTREPAALEKARAAFDYVDSARSATFARGACPEVNYQLPDGGGSRLKTLETDSNYIKAALLLYQLTGERGYVGKAEAKYEVVRRYFLTPDTSLYTVYVFDDGMRCSQLPGRYFGSVNGNMIWAGYHLADATGKRAYRDDAIATARGVARHLGDATGVYANLQAENDIVEPLVEAMYELAALHGQGFARDWILTAASASANTYGRFFNGPAPAAPITAWQVNGGIALRFAAAALDPAGIVGPDYWQGAVTVPAELRLGNEPVAFTFTGRAVAIIGTLGEQCCEAGHARVFLDGVETVDRTGIWQNKSSSGVSLPGAVLFAWRWPRSGTHTVEIRAGDQNAKEGGSYFHMTSYQVVGGD